jgi:Family of unknown function (DUF5343)
MANAGTETARGAKKPIPPYVAYKTFINFVNGLKQGIPARIDKSVMRLSGAAQSQLIYALRFFDLIEADGKPKESLTRLVNSEGAERKKLLKEMTVRAYSFVFNSDLDLNAATSKQVEELFGEHGVQGETARKAISLFLLFTKETEIKLSPHLKVPRTRRGGTRRRAGSGQNDQNGNDDSTPSVETKLSWEQMLLAKFPSFDPNWPEETQKRWFDAFDKLMKQSEEAE